MPTHIRKISRRSLGLGACALAITACTQSNSKAEASEIQTGSDRVSDSLKTNTDWADISEDAWRERLSPQAFNVLREHGTERAWTSPLNDLKAKGTYVCGGCELPLFKSDTKYDSGTGWPSFFDVIDGSIGTQIDNKLWAPRTEYHCSRCKGHQGHVFKDGPRPTGLRYCNNGVALKFIEA